MDVLFKSASGQVLLTPTFLIRDLPARVDTHRIRDITFVGYPKKRSKGDVLVQILTTAGGDHSIFLAENEVKLFVETLLGLMSD